MRRPDMSIDHDQDVDLYCDSCGYNLHGLDAHDLCPECGYPVTLTLRTVERTDAAVAWAERYLSIAKAAGLSRGTVALVMRAFRHARLAKLAHDVEGRAAPSQLHLDVAELCLALREVVEERFPEPAAARRRLEQLGLTCSEDV